MTYFGFLVLFLLVPIVILGALYIRDAKKKVALRGYLRHGSPAKVIMIMALVAVAYTTPWDNHLVASGVWWYDHNLVTGITLGWVPLEEYTFFVLQTLMSGLWIIFLARRFESQGITIEKSRKISSVTLLIGGLAWLWALSALIFNWNQGRYLALILVWALPPLALQLWFGSAILFKNYRLLLASILVPTLYLAGADTVAIQSGTWTINPQFSLNILLGGMLPIEEFLFFLFTNTLVTFGIVLAISENSKSRIAELIGDRPILPGFERRRLSKSGGD
ncbi:MAG: lycopene cyclase domain-containing protein [Anaerolineales bacterium]